MWRKGSIERRFRRGATGDFDFCRSQPNPLLCTPVPLVTQTPRRVSFATDGVPYLAFVMDDVACRLALPNRIPPICVLKRNGCRLIACGLSGR
jgi:hypothetical protein